MESHQIISLDRALKLAFSHAKPLGKKIISYQKAAGFVLAEDVFSDVNIPPFNKSAMDGYACKKEDLANPLEVLEVIAAGQSPRFSIGPGQCSKIMTGAEVPIGADTVIIVEHTEMLENNKIRFTGEKTNSNICLIGEDLQTGDLVLKAGAHLKAQHIAMLAAVGCISPTVYRQPKVGVISTGSELVEPEIKPQSSQIRNSNGHQIVMQARECNCQVTYYGIVKDKYDAILETIKKSTEENDLTLISGGVSVGDFDYVPLVIKELSFDILFNKLTVKPGKHTTFAVKDNQYIIGLPGNPVSSFIQFEVFAKPFIYKLMNFEQSLPSLWLPLAHDFKRRKSDRQEFIPVTLNNQDEVETIPYHGSAHIHAYHTAYGFMSVPMDTDQISKGELVYVRPL